MRQIKLSEVEFIAHVLATKMLEFDEPIPDFGTRFTGVLESCLAAPFLRWQKRIVYKGLLGKSAVLFYLMVKNHPFQNGNKRIAMTTLLVFLHRNNKWLKVDNQELYNFAVWVAESPASLKDDVVSGIEKFLKQHLVQL